jgi:ACS family glucarate transporter-like MFS transporter
MQEVYQQAPVRTTAPQGGQRWIVVGCAFLVAAVSYLDRNNISIAAGPLQRQFLLSNVQLGAVFSAFVLGYAFSQPLAGRVADRIGASRAIAIAIIWWSVFTALLPFVPATLSYSIGLLMAVRFLLGVGESIIFPASNRLIASWIPLQERGLANGIIFSGVGVGGSAAPPLITAIMVRYQWHWAFWLCALIGLLAGALWIALVRDTPAEQNRVGGAELHYIQAGLPIASSSLRLTAVHWRVILSDRHVLVLTVSYFCYGYVAYIFFTWLFKYLSDVRGLSLRSSAIYTMLPFIAMAVASSLGGWVSDRLLVPFGKRVARCGIAALSLLIAGIFVWLATQVHDTRVAALVLAGGAGALYFAQSAYWAMSADMGGASAGAVSGVMNMGCQLGGAVTASLTPVVATQLGWTASFALAAGICMVGAIAWTFIDPFHTVTDRSV